LVSENREVLGGEIGDKMNYAKKPQLIMIIKKFVREYNELVINEIPNYSPLEIRLQRQSTKTNEDECFVYLMFDTTNGYCKIGISYNPEYREKTLQSEKPTIELITSKKYPIRIIAESIEKALHKSFSEKRIRGEWFDLTEKDIEYIKETLK
jgi:hypothetical protein